MLELHHNAASTCSQKVRLVLAEKDLDYTSHEVDLIAGAQHAPEYVALNANHVVPTLVHDGRALIESTLINEYLDDAFPDTPMKPADAAGRHAMRLWTKRIDALHPNAGIITFAIGPRKMLMGRSPEDREAYYAQIPNPTARAMRRSVVENGVKAPEFAGAVGQFIDVLDTIESQLPKPGWLSGDDFGLADAGVLPYVLRLDQLAMTPMIAARPRVADWYKRVQARPAYTLAVSDWIPEAISNMFRSNGEEVWADVEPLTKANG